MCCFSCQPLGRTQTTVCVKVCGLFEEERRTRILLRGPVGYEELHIISEYLMEIYKY